jgi:hypothetical protein
LPILLRSGYTKPLMKVIQNRRKVIQNRGKVIQNRGKVIRIRGKVIQNRELRPSPGSRTRHAAPGRAPPGALASTSSSLAHTCGRYGAFWQRPRRSAQSPTRPAHPARWRAKRVRAGFFSLQWGISVGRSSFSRTGSVVHAAVHTAVRAAVHTAR